MILNLELYTQPNYQSVARIEYKHFQTCKVRNFGVNVQQNEGNKSGKKEDVIQETGSNAEENSRNFSR